MEQDQSKTEGGAAVRSSDLLACPFCGGNAVGIIPSQGQGRKFTILCCSDGGCTGQAWGVDEAEAVRRWNRRALPPDVVSVLEEMASYDTGEQPCMGADAKAALAKWQANDQAERPGAENLNA